MYPHRSTKVAAGLAVVVVCSAAALAAQSPDNSQGSPVEWQLWNFTSVRGDGHAGKMLIVARDQVHAGPGQTGVAEASAHWHWRNPTTGALDPKGIPVDPNWKALPGIALPPNDPNAVFASAPSQEVASQWARPVNSEITQALLSQGWRTVQLQLLRQQEGVLSPVVRALLGHAFLATNESNRALGLLSSVSLPIEVEGWRRWTAELSGQHPDNPVAAYLYGDALARSGNMAAAIAQFDQALDRQPTFALALDARGLARLASGSETDAEQDFIKLTSVAPGFADGHLSMGCYHLTKDEPDGALRAFERAAHVDSVSVLAANGEGCALHRLGKQREAASSFRRALSFYPHMQGAMNLAIVAGPQKITDKLTPGEGKAGTAFRGGMEWARGIGEVGSGMIGETWNSAVAYTGGQMRDAQIETTFGTSGFNTTVRGGIDFDQVGRDLQSSRQLSVDGLNRMDSGWNTMRTAPDIGGATILTPELSSAIGTANRFTLGYALTQRPGKGPAKKDTGSEKTPQ